MAKQQILTYGLRRSPILAARQKTPMNLKIGQVMTLLERDADLPVFVPVHDGREYVVGVRARADE